MGKFLVSITHSNDDPDRATVGFVVANAAAASGLETVVFLSSEGAYLAVQGGGANIAEEGFKSMTELINSFIEAEGKIWVCSPCFKKRKLSEAELLSNAQIVGGATMVEFIASGAGSVSY